MRFGKKVLLGPNTSALPVSTWLTTDTAFRALSGWRNSIGALVRYWQANDGAGDRVLDTLSVYPVLPTTAETNYNAMGVLATTLGVTSAAPPKPAAGDKVSNIGSSVASTVSGSAILTRASGSFISDGVVPGLMVSGTSNVPLGTLVKSVLDATTIEMSKVASGGGAVTTLTIHRPPALARINRYLWAGEGKLPTFPWPFDGINFGFHTTTGGTADLTGLMLEAWPIFDESQVAPVPNGIMLAGNEAGAAS